jgi:hypothetical protein
MYKKSGYAPCQSEGSGPIGDLYASDILNDSSVAGANVKEALDALLAAIGSGNIPRWHIIADLLIPEGHSYIIDEVCQEDGVTITQEDGGRLIIL